MNTERPLEVPKRRDPSLLVVAREWTRIGITGFGGPPAHIALLRQLVVDRYGWMDAAEFQDANAAANLLPGPASTQMAIFCAYRVAGPLGAVVGGLGFIVPAVVLIIALSVLFLAHNPPLVGARGGRGSRCRGGRGGGACRPGLHCTRAWVVSAGTAIECCAGSSTSWPVSPERCRGSYLVLVLLGAGLVELAIQRGRPR